MVQVVFVFPREIYLVKLRLGLLSSSPSPPPGEAPAAAETGGGGNFPSRYQKCPNLPTNSRPNVQQKKKTKTRKNHHPPRPPGDQVGAERRARAGIRCGRRWETRKCLIFVLKTPIFESTNSNPTVPKREPQEAANPRPGLPTFGGEWKPYFPLPF